MLIYWLIFLIPAWLAISHISLSNRAYDQLWQAITFLLIVIIGLRYQVGGDWETYKEGYQLFSNSSLSETIESFNAFQGDVGYNLLNWFSAQLGFNIYGVNLMSAAIFTWGLVKFCRFQPSPLLALAVAMPYLVTIVAMGYTRQSVAIGLAMAAITYLIQNRLTLFIILVIFASLFHKTAIILIPLIMLINSQNRGLTIIWASILIFLLAQTFREKATFLMQHYVHETFYQSSGATIRIIMNAVPAILFLFFRKQLCYNSSEIRLWTWVSLSCLALAILLQIFPSFSTPIDRLALYLIPIQLFVYSRLPILGRTDRDQQAIKGIIITTYGLTLFVWMNYAETAFAWLPYQFYLWTII